MPSIASLTDNILTRAAKLSYRTTADIAKGTYRAGIGLSKETYKFVKNYYVPAVKRLEPMALAVGATTALSAYAGIEAGMAGHYLSTLHAAGEIVGSKYLYGAYLGRQWAAQNIKVLGHMALEVAKQAVSPESIRELYQATKAGLVDIGKYVGLGKKTVSGAYAEGAFAGRAAQAITRAKQFAAENQEAISRLLGRGAKAAKLIATNKTARTAAVASAKAFSKSQMVQDAVGKIEAGQYKEAFAGFKAQTENIYNKYKDIPAHLVTATVLGGAGLIGYSGYKLWRRHQDNKERYNTISGLHPGNGGYSTSVIQSMTDFGSGWRGIIGVSEGIAKSLLGKSTSAGFMPMKALKGWLRANKGVTGFESLAKAFEQAESKGLPGMVMMGPGIERDKLKGLIAHERLHYWTEASGASYEGRAPEAFRQSLLKNPSYLRSFQRHGESVLTEEYLAYSRQFMRTFGKGNISSANQGFRMVFGSDLSAQAEAIAASVKKRGQAAIPIAGALHPGNRGAATAIIRGTTDFGSPVDLGKALLRAAGFMAKTAEREGTFIASEIGEETNKFHMAGAYKRFLQRPEPILNPDIEMTPGRINPPEWMKQRIKEKLQERPTAGLVTNVLGTPQYHRGHASYPGKS